MLRFVGRMVTPTLLVVTALSALPAAAAAQSAQFASRVDRYAMWKKHSAGAGKRILVSIEDRWLWLVEDGRTVMSAPVAVGMSKDFDFSGKRFRFETPRGQRKVLNKAAEPIWVPPDWHYYEKAVNPPDWVRREGFDRLEVVFLQEGQPYDLGDGTFLDVRGAQVGRVNQYGSFAPWTPGKELIFYGKIFVPPINTAQRRIPDALGPFKLDLGNGYMIHGTHEYNADSVGEAVSHGCVRMDNEDVTRLHDLVGVGTPVIIY